MNKTHHLCYAEASTVRTVTHWKQSLRVRVRASMSACVCVCECADQVDIKPDTFSRAKQKNQRLIIILLL